MHYVYVVYGDAFATHCKMSQETVMKHDPNAAFTVYTDKEYDIIGETVVETFHYKPFMLMNVICQAHWLSQREATGEPVAFMDADAFLLRPLELPEGSWDIAPTYRENMGNFSNLMPYNYGVVFARRTVCAQAAWWWMCDHITHQTPTNQRWYGNQVALRELCGAPKANEDVVVETEYFDVTVHSLPCEQYNWTPEGEEPVEDRFVVHCKGDRKDLLAHYYNEIMEAA